MIEHYFCSLISMFYWSSLFSIFFFFPSLTFALVLLIYPLLFHVSSFSGTWMIFFSVYSCSNFSSFYLFKSCIYCYVSSRVEEIKDICAFFFPKKIHLFSRHKSNSNSLGEECKWIKHNFVLVSHTEPNEMFWIILLVKIPFFLRNHTCILTFIEWRRLCPLHPFLREDRSLNMSR